MARSPRLKILVAGMALPLLAACASPAPTAAPTAVPEAAPPTLRPAMATPVATTVAAATSAPLSPTSIASPTAVASGGPVTRTVDALAYTHDDKGHPSGVLSPVTLSVQSGPRSQEFRLGFFETDVNQMGAMWRAAGWMAAAVGALETGKDPNSLQVSWQTKGFVDGPSAGGLMTAAFISALQNDQLRPDVAFTGTINPDGSIGPVGGIQYKLEAAAKQGKKLMLIPIGQRYDVDEETQQTVDVIQKGQLLGLKVQEIATIDDAYEALTGKTLPRESTSKTPDLSPDAYDRMKPKVLDWEAEYQDAVGRFKSTDPRVQALFADSAAEVDAKAKAADKALSQGSVAEAYSHIQQATVGANTLALGAHAVEVLLATQDFDAANQALAQSAGASRVQPLMERLRTFQPNSPEDAILAVEAASDALEAVALDDAVSREIDAARSASSQDDAFTHVFTAAAFQSAQKYAARAAEDALTFSFGRSTSSNKKVDPQALDDWAGVFQRAAQANLSYFDAVVLDQAAQEAGIRTEQAKARFEAASFSYQVAEYGASPAAQQYLDKTIGKGAAANYAHLGFAVASYLASSELVAEHYSLGAQTDADGTITGFERDRALGAMLDAASDRARERIAAAAKAGIDPSLAIVAFQDGHASRDGDPSDKLGALRSFWTASTYARLLTLMTQGGQGS